MKHAYLVLLAALAAGTASGQSGKQADPADSQARVPAAPYRSAFEGYRSLEEPKRIPWRNANEEAARVGGHLGILREQAARGKPSQGELK